MSGFDERGKNGAAAREALRRRLGWPEGENTPPARARAQLLALLVEEFGVNEAGVELILHLLSQMHALERRLDLIGRALRRLPPDSRTLFEAEFRLLCRVSPESDDE